MKTSFLSTMLGLTAIVAAAPTPNEAQALKIFNLKTESADKRFNGLCAYAYHTGAGTADAVLGKCSKTTDVFYSNGTRIDANFFGNLNSFDAFPGTTYDEWYPATINAGYGSDKYTYSIEQGFLSRGQYGFIACEWAHAGAKQLFVLAQDVADTTVIETCALVKLVKG